MLTKPAEENIQLVPQRNHGSALLTVLNTSRGNHLDDLFQQGCAKIRLPNIHDRENFEAIMINTAGGMTGGDELSWRFSAQEKSQLTVTSQACERLYRSNHGRARISVALEAKDRATLFWLPQETILFDNSNAHRKIRIRMNGDARVLMVESLIFGRKAMRETLSQVSFIDEWTITHDDKPIHTEVTRIDTGMHELMNKQACLGENTAIATVVLLAPASAPDLEIKLGKVRSLCSRESAVSFWQVGKTGKLLARLVANDSYELRKSLIPIVSQLLDDAILPKAWSV